MKNGWVHYTLENVPRGNLIGCCGIASAGNWRWHVTKKNGQVVRRGGDPPDLSSTKALRHPIRMVHFRWTRSLCTSGTIRHPLSTFNWVSKSKIFRRSYSRMSAQLYHCGIDAEPLHRYQPGGYHPLGLGDFLKDGRYQVLHKLGWGGYSTTWAAKDHKYPDPCGTD